MGGSRIRQARFALLLTALSLAASTRYPVTGIVLKVDRPRHSFDASCSAIPGYMEAMAMPYTVLDEHQLDGLKPGAYVVRSVVRGSEGEQLTSQNLATEIPW